MNKLISKFVDYLIVNKIICEDMREMHIYSFEVMIGKVLSYGTLLLLSWMNQDLPQTLVFMIVFFSLRSRNGGFHASKFLHCYFGTIFMYFCTSKIVVPVILMYKSMKLYIVAISVLIVFLFAPINHPNLHLTDSEMRMCKYSARRLIIFISMCVMALAELGIISEYLSYAIAGMGMNAGLLLIAKILRQEVK